MTVTIAGIFVGNIRTRALPELMEFKEQLTLMLIGMLFVILAADVRMREIANLGWNGLFAVLALMLLVRPLNVLVGTWYLGKLLRRYQHTDGPVAYALADYNAGRRHVLRWTEGAAATNTAVFLKEISYPGTRRYIEKVVQRLQFYRRATAHSG